MKKLLDLYFLYDDEFVIHEILWTQEDAEKMSKYYSCDYVHVQVLNDPNVIDSLLTFAPTAYPPEADSYLYVEFPASLDYLNSELIYPPVED